MAGALLPDTRMTVHAADEPWLNSILSHLSETTCTLSGMTLHVEFKENFNFSNLGEYARTLAGFANTGGGYLVFGVTDEPRNLVGMANERFASLDPARLSTELNKVLEPSLVWRHGTLLIGQLKIGYVYVAESRTKPVIVRRTESNLREGAIYYRYPGMTTEIRHAELAGLISAIRESADSKWLALLSRIATIGVENTAVLN